MVVAASQTCVGGGVSSRPAASGSHKQALVAMASSSRHDGWGAGSRGCLGGSAGLILEGGKYKMPPQLARLSYDRQETAAVFSLQKMAKLWGEKAGDCSSCQEAAKPCIGGQELLRPMAAEKAAARLQEAAGIQRGQGSH
jgi:hypothetical protein